MNKRNLIFQFREFSVVQQKSAMKIGTDGVLLGAWTSAADSGHILDAGTGTGVIALMLAQRFPEARIHGIEPETNAFTEASYNLENSPWSDRLSVSNEMLQHHSGSYDLIVINPPYYADRAGTAARTMARSSMSLPAEDILEAAERLLTDKGELSIILPVSEGRAFLDLAPSYGLFLKNHCTVYSDIDRPVRRMMRFINRPSQVSQESIHIRCHGRYSEQYLDLTRPFYIDLNQEMN